MKLKLLLMLIIIGIGIKTNVKAQSFEITPFAGYTFGDETNFSYGSVKIKDSFSYGIAVAYYPNELYSIDLSYDRQDTKLEGVEYLATADRSFEGDIGMNYILLGGSGYFGEGKIKGYGGISAGVGFVSPKDFDVSSEAKFAYQLRLGAKIKASEKIGVRLQAQLNSPVNSAWGTYIIGPAGGVGVSTYSTIYQFSLNGGLIFSLSK